jgi:hypothetical protein
MKTVVPGTILAASLNLSAFINAELPLAVADPSFADETKRSGDISSSPDVVSVTEGSAEFYTTVQEVVGEIEWDKCAEKRFQALAIKEALETLNGAELVELEQLTIARRKHTAPPTSAEEILDELREWKSVNRVFEALDRYVQEIGIKRNTFTNRS